MRAALAASLVCFAAVATADQARVVMPHALAARAELGERWGTVFAAEAAGELAIITITQALTPLAPPATPLDVAACPDPQALFVPPGLRPPAEVASLARRSPDALALIADVIGFVARRVRLDEHDRGEQDAMSVLARGRARCSGRANLAVGLLRGVGVPARVVNGLLLGDRTARWHRWGEAWVGAAGWLPFDIDRGAGVVGVRYLPLAGAGEEVSLSGVRVEQVLETSFLALPRRGRLALVPTRAARLRCIGAGPLAAVLEAADGTRVARSGEGSVAFDDLLPGRYLLRWQRGDKAGTLELLLEGEREVRLDR